MTTAPARINRVMSGLARIAASTHDPRLSDILQGYSAELAFALLALPKPSADVIPFGAGRPQPPLPRRSEPGAYRVVPVDAGPDGAA